jgi:ribosomal protein S18 acetylase RimI-like enzyme
MAPDDIDLWMEVTIDGFAHADEGPLPTENPPHDVLEGIFRDMSGVPGFRRYLATVKAVAVAAASMRIDGSLAQLTGAATLPAFRRRGLQTALTSIVSPTRARPAAISPSSPRRRGRSRRRTRNGVGSSCCMRERFS